MTLLAACALMAGWFLGTLAEIPRQGVDDPEIRAAVERFYATQEAEDIDAYLALWSTAAERLRQVQQLRMQLKFIFDGGDDRFSDIALVRVMPIGDRLRVRVSAMRVRTTTRPDGTQATVNSTILTNLTFVRDGTALKLVGEGPPTDDLAEALIQAATPEAREALLTLEPELVTVGLAMSLARRADEAAQGNRFALAQTIYHRVLEIARRIGDRRAEGQALQNIANARYFVHNFAGALEAYEQRLAVERAAENDEGIASSLFGIATVKYSSYEYAAALTNYEEALRLQEKLQDNFGLPVTLLSTGNVRYLQGDLVGAIADYRRSRDLQKKMGNPAGEAKALEGLGRASAALGDFAAALESYAGVVQEAHSRSDRSAEGHAIQNIGEIHMRLGNLDTARGLFDQSRAHFESRNDQASIGRVWHAAALTDLLAARFAAAEQEYSKSSAACVLANESYCVAQGIVGLAFAQASQTHYGDAIPTYAKAIAAFTALKKLEDAARAELGLSQALLGKKDYMSALVAARRARLQAVGIEEDDVVWRAAVAEARALRRLEKKDAALTAAQDAVAAVQRLGRVALDRPGDTVAADSVEAYALLAVLQVEAGDAAGAFATVEARRALALRVALARHEREIARGMTAAERDRERTNDTGLASLYLQLDHERVLPKPDPARVARFQQMIAEAVKVRQGERQRLFEQRPELAAWRGLAPPATLADANSILAAPGTLLVEFVIDDDDLVVVTAAMREEKIEVHAYTSPVTRLTLAERIARAVDPVVLRNMEEWRKASLEIVTAVPPDAFAELAAAPKAIIVPDGVFWRVPFEALPVKGGSLADQTVITYAGSLTSLVRSPAPEGTTTGGPILAVAAPELTSVVRDRLAATAPGWTLRSPETADLEVQRVVAEVGEPVPAVRMGASATESAFRAEALDRAVLHLAGPFRMNSASPLFSPVLLAGDAGTSGDRDSASDGVLEAREVMNLGLRASVTVLSDGAALSMRDAAAVTPTVQWAWRVAGVPSVVFRRWSSDDAAGAELVAAFHRGLKDGAPPEAALHAARAAVRAREGMNAPYFWADWMIVGK